MVQKTDKEETKEDRSAFVQKTLIREKDNKKAENVD